VTTQVGLAAILIMAFVIGHRVLRDQTLGQPT
jgi:hypothetical protein